MEVGAVVEITEVFVKVITLKTKANSYSVTAIMSEGGIKVNGNQIVSAGRAVWQSEVK